jgi:thymidylate kinase
MVRIITFEGADYSGKSATFIHLAKMLKGTGIVFNEGSVYQSNLTSRLLTIAGQANEHEREFIYTTLLLSDAAEARLNPEDNRLIIQDRYWPSVVAYGRFLNGRNSIHWHQDYSPLFIKPVSTIHFSCSVEEKIRRSQRRGRKSVIDDFLLNNPEKFKDLQKEIHLATAGLPNFFSIDTSDKSIEDVALAIAQYLEKLEVIKT